MKRTLLLFLALSLPAVVLDAAWAADSVALPRTPSIEVQQGTTLLAFPAASLVDDTAAVSQSPGAQGSGDLGAVIALPRNTASAVASLARGESGSVRVSHRIMRLRGQPVALVTVSDPPDGPFTVAVRHDGDWHAKSDDRHLSSALHAGLPGVPPVFSKSTASAPHPLGGSYVVISAPQYAATVTPLVEWKTRKGWPVALVTTDETGISTADIKVWLQHAYDNWPRPPEYVLLVGDVEDIPAFYIDGNVSDHPYTLLDGDDWLPDLMLGRFSVANATECAAMVAKTVHYERQPYLDQDHWFTRGVMIGGQYGSTTPMHTVRFCGEQLERLGFEPLVPVTPTQHEGTYIVSPPDVSEQIGIMPSAGPQVISGAINTGCSFVVYRGWAYGTAGWNPPTFVVADIQTLLQNGAMLPVVMSFVCHTGNFAATVPCMGEAFTRLGGSDPAQLRGAVAFYGTGEPWSNTRFNDAMAISHFERVIDPHLATLGSLIVAGKLRFVDFYPSSLEESSGRSAAEFYFHIYNLLGDPELNYHRARPEALVVGHPTDLAAGTSFVECTVAGASGAEPAAGARVGVVQAGRLLGATLTDENGTARIVLTPAVEDGPVHLTVTRPGNMAYTAVLNALAGDVHLALEELGVTDQTAKSAVIRPGADLALMPTIRNLGTTASAAATLELTADGPAQITSASSSLGPLNAGASANPDAPFSIIVAADAPDGAVISGRLSAHHGAQEDLSGFQLVVQAPEFVATVHVVESGAWVEPGVTTDLMVSATNVGSLGTAGGVMEFSIAGPPGAELLTENLPFGALEPGDRIDLGPLALRIDPAIAGGTTVNIRISVTHEDGALQITSVPVAVGRGDVTEPSGPDAYGYFAYDSADLLYPDQRPVYRWFEISSAFGGPGTKLPLVYNNLNRDVVVDLPFTFRFYGQDFDRARVSDNGWLSFDADNDFYSFYNWPIPLAHGCGALVAPFWDNLTPEPHPNPDADPVGMSSDGIYWYYDEPAGEVIFEWSRMRHVYDQITELQTFQAVLRDPQIHATTPTGDGEILYFYKQVADNDHMRMYATVGIESPDETDGLQLTYDGVRARGFAPLGPGMAVRLTTSLPVRVPLTVDALHRRQIDGRAELFWTLTDERPVVGWNVYALGHDGRICLTPQPLSACARLCSVDADPEAELQLEALLPFGGSCEAGKARGDAADLRFALADPLPNPVGTSARLAFALPREGGVQLRVYDVRGRCVASLVNERFDAGSHLVVWEGRDDGGRRLPDGIYFLRLEQAGQALTRKILLVR